MEIDVEMLEKLHFNAPNLEKLELVDVVPTQINKKFSLKQNGTIKFDSKNFIVAP
jgi:hypothetical protein